MNLIWDPAGADRRFTSTASASAFRRRHPIQPAHLSRRGSVGARQSGQLGHHGVVHAGVPKRHRQRFLRENGFGSNPRLNPLYDGPIAGAYRHYLKALVDYSFDFGLTMADGFSTIPACRSGKSSAVPRIRRFRCIAHPRGSSTGTRVNDPTTWAAFNLPDALNLDLQVAYGLEADRRKPRPAPLMRCSMR